jgi:hypothetical protein
MSDSPPLSQPHYIVSGQRVGVGYGKVLIPNPNYKGKGCTELASSNLTQRCSDVVLLQRFRGLPETMEFTNDDMELEKEELSNELVASRM